MLLILVGCLWVLPSQVARQKADYFLLPEALLPDTVETVKVIKAPSPIELNTADSATLVQIKGIGPYFANRILQYRQRLGGYCSVKQLKEIKSTYFQADSLMRFFTADPRLIQKKDLNRMNFKEVLKHPYLEYEDVKLIFDAKKKYHAVSFDTLEKRKVLPFYKLRKIKPYFR